jgi:hypothetical protein
MPLLQDGRFVSFSFCSPILNQEKKRDSRARERSSVGCQLVELRLSLENGPYERLFSSFSFFWPLIAFGGWTILLFFSYGPSQARKQKISD